MAHIHLPILLEEAIESLAIIPDGVYIDATFGRGGHSLKILQSLGPKGRLIALDKDPEAVNVGKTGPFCDMRFNIELASFAELFKVAEKFAVTGKVKGILFDLGVSSPQLDDPKRGFSFLREGPLDMRMNLQQKLTAADWLNQASEKEIADVLWKLGEERASRKIAAAIVMDRKIQAFTTTTQLASLLVRLLGHHEKKHPATRSFQAIRMFINNELGELEAALQQSLEVLETGGRLSVISFHSLEDRMVKQFMHAESEKDFFGKSTRHWRRVSKLITPSEQEVKNNPRARSARLRIAEKIA